MVRTPRAAPTAHAAGLVLPGYCLSLRVGFDWLEARDYVVCTLPHGELRVSLDYARRRFARQFDAACAVDGIFQHGYGATPQLIGFTVRIITLGGAYGARSTPVLQAMSRSTHADMVAYYQ